MAGITPPGSLHYLMYGLNPIPEGQTERHSGPVQPTMGIKFDPSVGFETGADMGEEEYHGHTGAFTTLIDKDRTDAKGAPAFGDHILFGQGIEDMWAMLLGVPENPTPAVAGAATAKKWNFQQDVTDPTALPWCTLVQGLNYKTMKPEVYADAVLNSLELTMNSNKAPTYKPTFLSDHPIPNQTEPSLTFYSGIEYMLKAGQAAVYIGPAGTSKASLKNDSYKVDCYTDASLNASNNFESKPCGGNDFGKNKKDQKPFTGKGTIKMDLNESNMNFESKYWTGSTDGTELTTETLKEAILISYTGQLIETVTGTPDVPVYCMHDIFIPKAHVKYTRPHGGSDPLYVQADYDILANNLSSAIEVDIISPLDALNYGTVPT